MAKLIYNNKTNAIPIVDRDKQATAEDFNDIKSVVNENADLIPDYPMNYRAKGDPYDMQFMDSLGALKKGDFVIAQGSTGTYIKTGDFLVSAQDNDAQSYDASDYPEPDMFMRIGFSDLISGEMTAAEIVAALETLNNADMLSATKVKYTDTVTVTGKLSSLESRLMFGWDSEINYYVGHIAIRNNLLYLSISSNNINHVPPNATYWTPIGMEMTAVEIASLLNNNGTVGQMVKANRVQVEDEGITVKQKLTDLLALITANTNNIATKQSSVLTKRIVYSTTPDRLLSVTGITTKIIQMCINRVPYQGIEADAFEDNAGNYDFIYQFTTADGPKVTIMLHPDLEFNFEPGNLIDLIY